ncbi:MAG: roadblock/LC7 domain-containing protein [Promethearchaeota archaeon]
MIETDEIQIDKILIQILKSSPGIRYVILMDRAGLTISYQIKFKTNKSDYIERLGAIGGAVFQAVEQQGDMINYGSTISQITEYDKGYIFSMATGDGILCVITEKNINMGLIRSIMRKYRKTISEILKRYLKQDQDEISKELRKLFDQSEINLL